jgi:hypothetical protein
MQRERVSIQNFLRASEIFLDESDDYSPFEQVLLRAMLRRLSAKVNRTQYTEPPGPIQHT